MRLARLKINNTRRTLTRIGLALLFILAAQPALAYSVLSHEALIDALWLPAIRPALRKRFPEATPQQLKEAHSYAYGGAIMQDMGYYPHNNGYFSDLTHYARSAELIQTLIANSTTLDEYAFALGALSHYAGDNDGHRLGTNLGEPLLYPKLRRKFGDVVTYEDNPYAHLQTEYSFDVAQLAQHNYAPTAYHDFIGFNVATPLLERAFRETYGFEITQTVPDFDRAMESYRHTLSTLIPFFTRVAWADHQDQIQRARPGVTKRQFLYVMRRSSYEREWGNQYDRPTLVDRIVALLVKVLPPIGEIRVLKFHPITPAVETIMMKSFDAATPEYRRNLEEVERHALRLENTNFDVGVVTRPGQYKLQDQTYAYWLEMLSDSHFAGVTPAVAANILAYYSDPNAPITTKKNPKQWRTVMLELAELKNTPAASRTSVLPAAGRPSDSR